MSRELLEQMTPTNGTHGELSLAPNRKSPEAENQAPLNGNGSFEDEADSIEERAPLTEQTFRDKYGLTNKKYLLTYAQTVILNHLALVGGVSTTDQIRQAYLEHKGRSLASRDYERLVRGFEEKGLVDPETDCLALTDLGRGFIADFNVSFGDLALIQPTEILKAGSKFLILDVLVSGIIERHGKTEPLEEQWLLPPCSGTNIAYWLERKIRLKYEPPLKNNSIITTLREIEECAKPYIITTKSPLDPKVLVNIRLTHAGMDFHERVIAAERERQGVIDETEASRVLSMVATCIEFATALEEHTLVRSLITSRDQKDIFDMSPEEFKLYSHSVTELFNTLAEEYAYMSDSGE